MKSLFFSLFVLVTLTGCFSSKTAPETKQTFTFDYSTRESQQPGSATMLVGIVKPFYAQEFTSGSGELFQAFQIALGRDIEELIIAKGFSLKGPYLTFGEMVFEDKKRTEMLIEIEISPRFTAQEGGWKSKMNLLDPRRPYYYYTGKASLVGKINISGIEPLTNQKIWSKSVLIPNVENITIETTGKYNHVLNTHELINDPGVYNALGKALMTQYNGIMDKIGAHFNVDEFKTLKPQVKELKALKGY